MNKKLFLVLCIIGNTYSKNGLVEELAKADLLQAEVLLEGRKISADVRHEMSEKVEEAYREASSESLTKKEWLEFSKGTLEFVVGAAAVVLAVAACVADPDKNFGMVELVATGAVAAAGCMLAPLGGLTMKDAYNKKPSVQKYTELFAKYQLIQGDSKKDPKNYWG